MSHQSSPLFLMAVLLVIISLLVIPFSTAGCSPDSSSKGNPKLASALKQLIEAEKRGELESVARQGNIKLVDGKVSVTIECLSGKAEKVAQAATQAAAEQVRVNNEYNFISALVPITSLATLANETGVKFIRLPISWTPAESN